MRKLTAMTRLERFLAKVNKQEGEACWLWTGALSTGGYGRFWDGNRHIQAHWFLLEKYPDKGMHACHHCDNPKCVRPSHIFIGTPTDNAMDMVAKGRNDPERARRWMKQMLTWRKVNHGEKNHMAKITDFDAGVIRAMGMKWGAGAAASRHFGISQAGVSKIRLGMGWSKSVPGDAEKAKAAELLKEWGLE